MSLQDVGLISELISAIAVVLSLLYVAKQIRDSSTQTKRNTATVLAAIAQDGFAPIYNTPENLRIWHVGRFNPDELDEGELRTFFMFMERQLWNYENSVSAYHDGTYEKELFDNLSAAYGAVASTPGGLLYLEKGDLALTDKAKEYLGVA